MFLIPVPAPTIIAAVSHTASFVSTANLTTYTFAGASFGAAAASRKIVIVACGGLAAAVGSTVTIGGVSGSSVIEKLGDGGELSIIMWQADVPTGTTGDIVIAWSGAQGRMGLEVYRIINAGTGPSAASATVSDGADDGGGVLALTVTVPALGVVISGAANNNGDRTTWANVTEDADNSIGEGSYEISSGSEAYATLQTSLAVTATVSGTGTSEAGVAASWAPA
jgi:hypothetical protein